MADNRIKTVIAIAVLFILVLTFFYKIAFSNQVLARGDLFLFFYPYWETASTALANGELPTWNEHLFMGAPLLANSQVGFFYPLNWLVWLIFETPKAISISIVIHIMVAGLGAYVLGRKCLRLGQTGSLIVAVIFALGGYVTSQVEHINQLQGMAWLPWLIVVQCRWMRKKFSWRAAALPTLFMAILLSLQLLAGHTQSTFISLTALLIWTAADIIISIRKSDISGASIWNRVRLFFRWLMLAVVPLLLGSLTALLLTSVQLLPTFELASQSTRQGGLPPSEVLSFSLHPLNLGRALLPISDTPIFSEYAAGIPIAALILAIVAARLGRGRRTTTIAVVFAAVGLLLSIGAFNPLYHLLARFPIFNLFRAPARWLILYTLGIAMLAGLGWQRITDRKDQKGDRAISGQYKNALIIAVVVVLALMAWAALSVLIARYVPEAAEAPIQMPSLRSWVFWIVELAIAAILIHFITKRNHKALILLIPFIIVAVLFLGSREQPYDNPTTPEAYTDLRPPAARLLASEKCTDDGGCPEPKGRLLSMSEIFFDVGDQDEIDSIYDDQLPEEARYDYTVAIKQKEILGPNLPLVYGLSSVDGFDGGLLPLKNYSEITKLLLEEGAESIDGRLREYVTEVPEEKWLDLFNVRYLITDKVGDQWREGVFFDLHNSTLIEPGDASLSVGHVPTFESTEAWLLFDGHPGQLQVTSASGDEWIIDPEIITNELAKYRWPYPTAAENISLIPCTNLTDAGSSCKEIWLAKGLSLVDRRDDTFFPLVLGDYKIIHSGDVKIFENLDVLPRAFLVNKWTFVPDAASSIEAMKATEFDPTNEAVIIGEGASANNQDGENHVAFLAAEPTAISLSVTTGAPALLVLTDSIYPGWKVNIDGQEAEIYQTDVNFRGVLVPEGEHSVDFSYQSSYLRLGLVLTVIGLLCLLALGLVAYQNRGRYRSQLK